MKKIQTRITLTYILLTVIVVVSVGILSSLEIESFFKKRLASDLSTQADIILSSLQQDTTLSMIEFDRRMRNLAHAGNVRITLIETQGKVIDDSEVPLDSISNVENHLQRLEIQQAARGTIGVSTRHSATVGKDFIYLAKIIPDQSTSGGIIRGVHYIRLSLHLEELYTVIATIRLRILVAAIIVFILVLFVSRIVSRRISKPMVDIATSAREIQAGNLDKHIPVETNDEIGQVAQAVNELVEKLKTDIVQLRKLEQIRSEFLGNVSHELRTPIFSVQGFLETLLNGAIDDPNVNRKFVQTAYTHAERLNTLLTDLINISQIESGEMRMSFRYFDLSGYLEQVVSEMTPEAEKKKITLRLQIPGSPTEVFGDKERIKQALVNLIDNAIKYTQPEGSITVSYSHDGARARITVADTGVGIAQEHLPRLFERFYRVDKERSREVGGTGLGLAIVKHIIEAHGSKVEVQSQIGKGSAFSFDLKAG
jgi:two-component system, OmpR family, phosphate regulon sensor histidine kinase PhoR